MYFCEKLLFKICQRCLRVFFLPFGRLIFQTKFLVFLLSIFPRIFQYAGGHARAGGWRRRGSSQETQKEKVPWQHHSKAS
jgi:hypothetical protein